MGEWVCTKVFIFISLINMPVSIAIPCSFYYYCSALQLVIRDSYSSIHSVIVQDCVIYPEFFVFPYEVENCFCNVCKGLC